MIIASQVDDGLFRGPRPDHGDYPALSARFRSIISLEGENEDFIEARWLDTKTCVLYSCPISIWQIYVAGISFDDLTGIVHDMVNLPRPLLIHCQHGEDRTGMAVAAYRMFSGWEFEKAWAEALSFGYHSWLNRGLNRTLDKWRASCQK